MRSVLAVTERGHGCVTRVTVERPGQVGSRARHSRREVSRWWRGHRNWWLRFTILSGYPRSAARNAMHSKVARISAQHYQNHFTEPATTHNVNIARQSPTLSYMRHRRLGPRILPHRGGVPVPLCSRRLPHLMSCRCQKSMEHFCAASRTMNSTSIHRAVIVRTRRVVGAEGTRPARPRLASLEEMESC